MIGQAGLGRVSPRQGILRKVRIYIIPGSAGQECGGYTACKKGRTLQDVPGLNNTRIYF